ncbi:retrovirus-related pol polyprotein from transposon TNT 1-94 [Tanacetum coccineum]
MLTVMNSMSLNNSSVNMKMQKCELCEKCLNLNAELSKSKQAYNDLLKNHSQLEKHCISLEVSMQLKQEVFQNDKSCVNHNAVEIQEYFEINDLKAQLQAKDKTICKLKDTIRSLSKNAKEENVNHDKCELEPINEELENSVATLLSENEHLCNEINQVKQVFKAQFDLIKQTRFCHKEHSDSLISKLNLKTMENEDLKAQIQDKIDLEPLPPRLLQNSELDLACKYITRIQELLVYVQDTYPNAIPPSAKKHRSTVESSNTSDSNTPVLSSIGVKCSTSNCGSKPPSNKKNNRISQPPSRNKKNKVEAQPRKVNKRNRVVKPVCNVDVKHSLSNANSDIICATCNKSMFDGVHDKCLLDLVQNGNKCSKSTKKHKKRNIWKPTGHVFTDVGFKWTPTGKIFTIVGNSCPLTRITSTNVVQIVLWYLDSGCSKHMTGNRSQLMNFVSKFLGTVRFKNDQIARIMGYCDYQLGNIIISRVYCVEGLGHNLFFVGQFCDADLEVAFWKNTCFIRNLEGVNLLSRSRDINLYIISLDDMLKSSPICLLSKASKTKSWLWHHRLSHLNFGTLNKLAKDGLARGIPRLKFQKDNLCLACALGKNKKSSHQPKAEDTNQEKLYLLHIDLCGPIIVAVLKEKVQNVRTDNGSEFVNQTLREWYENVGILHRTSAARTPQQNSAEAINTACYTQNRSLIRLRYNKTPYELMQDKKPDLSFFYVFGSLCYPTNDHEDLAMASEQFSSGPGLQGMTPATPSTGLVSNLVSQQPCIPPITNDWDHLFQPMLNEYFNPPSIAVSPVQEAAAPRAKVLADSPVSTSIDQDAPSTSIPSSQEHEQSPIISQGFEESPKTLTFHDDPLNESPNEDSTSNGSSSNVRQIHTPFEHLGRWTKDHPIANVIGDPSRSVSTRKQLKIDAMWCYFDAFLTSVEPKNFK